MPQKGDDADNIVLFNDTLLYLVAAGANSSGSSSQPIIWLSRKVSAKIFQTHRTFADN